MEEEEMEKKPFARPLFANKKMRHLVCNIKS